MTINLILMAAGNSSRFYRKNEEGRVRENKLFAPFEGMRIYDRAIRTVKEAASLLEAEDLQAKAIAVTRYKEIREAAQAAGLTVVWSEKSELGISETIKSGMSVCEEGFYVFLTADQPLLQASSIKRLVTETLSSKKPAGRIYDGTNVGNPVIFSPQFREDLLMLKGDKGGGSLLKGREGDCYLCKAEAVELMDTDTWESYQLLLEKGCQ